MSPRRLSTNNEQTRQVCKVMVSLSQRSLTLMRLYRWLRYREFSPSMGGRHFACTSHSPHRESTVEVRVTTDAKVRRWERAIVYLPIKDSGHRL